jgi:hypothetical protein
MELALATEGMQASTDAIPQGLKPGFVCLIDRHG